MDDYELKEKEMKFISGSSANPKDMSRFSLSLFNYTKCEATGEISDSNVNNGIDGEGPGIYAFGKPLDGDFLEEEIQAANNYAGLNGKGSVLGFTVNMMDDFDQEIEFINDYGPDHISEEEWVRVIESMVDEIRIYHSFDIDTDDPDDDPAQFIEDEGGPHSIARYAINSSDDLWSALKKVWNASAVVTTGLGVQTYNKLFERAAINNVDDSSCLRVARESDDRFYIIFDTSEIDIEYARKYSYEVEPEKFSSMIKEMGQSQIRYSDTLEYEQLEMKLNEIAKKHFGVELPDNTVARLSRCKSDHHFYDSVLDEVRSVVGSYVEDEWEKRKGAKNQFDGVELVKPVQEKQEKKQAFRIG